MNRPSRAIPLSLANLVHDRRRLILAIAGIGFAVLLMCMQLGFRNALLDSTVAMIRSLDAELVIVGAGHYTLIVREPFPQQRLVDALADRNVAEAWPLYFEMQRSLWVHPRADEGQLIRVLAFNPRHPVFRQREIQDQAALLESPGALLFDRKSKPEYGAVAKGTSATLAGHPIEVRGLFSLGTDFAYNGHVLLSDREFRRLFPRPGGGDPLSMVDVGLLKLRSPDAAEEVAASLSARMPPDVKVLTIDDFVSQELDFWKRGTPIGYVFQLGTLMGFIVGVIICYQILYTGIQDTLAEYATLKAMGYPDRYFVRVVFEQALCLSVLGFIPGALASTALYGWLAARTGLPLTFSWSLGALVLGLTVLMCVLSGALAIRRLLATDPAELFR